MNEAQLRARFPNASQAFLRANAGTPPLPANPPPETPPRPQDWPKPRLRQHKGDGLNGWEREYKGRLEILRPLAHIHRNVGLPLANGVRYYVDFLLAEVSAAGLPVVEGHEVKGRSRPAGIVKIKVAAKEYPWISFWLATKKRKAQGGGWQIDQVLK